MKFRLRILVVCLFVGCIAADVVRAEDSVRSEPSGVKTTTLSQVQAVILGFVEGMTEYLPVSSTGHLLIVMHLLGMDGDERQKDAADSLAICIQAGAILAVLVLYFSRIRQILAGMMGRDKDGLRLLINLIIAFLPAGIAGLLFKKIIKGYLFGVLPVSVALFVGGVLILQQAWTTKLSDANTGKEMAEMSWGNSLFVGFMQCLALWPGFSRSLATILGCRWSGVRMSAAVEFSFLLGLVTLSAATGYEGLKHGKEMIANYGIDMLAIAFVTAFVAAVVSVKFMVGALNKYGLSPFGYYRILLAVACICWLYR